MVNQFHTERVLSYLQDHGGNVLSGVQNPSLIDASKLFIEPTIIENPRDDSKLMTEEIFGPVMPIKTFKNIDEAIHYVKVRPKPLVCYYFGPRYAPNFHKVEKLISAGCITFNEVLMHTICKDLPFGGVGASGYGRYHSKYGFQNMSNPKSILNKFWSNFYPYNVFALPFTELKKKTTLAFVCSPFFRIT